MGRSAYRRVRSKEDGHKDDHKQQLRTQPVQNAIMLHKQHIYNIHTHTVHAPPTPLPHPMAALTCSVPLTALYRQIDLDEYIHSRINQLIATDCRMYRSCRPSLTTFCTQLLLCYVYAHQDLFTSCHNVAMSLYDIIALYPPHCLLEVEGTASRLGPPREGVVCSLPCGGIGRQSLVTDMYVCTHTHTRAFDGLASRHVHNAQVTDTQLPGDKNIDSGALLWHICVSVLTYI